MGVAVQGALGHIKEVDLANSPFGGFLQLETFEEEVVLNTGGTTTDTVNTIPQYAQVIAVAVRVTQAITTATVITVGDTGAAAKYNNGTVGLTLGSTDPGTKNALAVQANTLAVRLTTTGTPGAGKVRVFCTYLKSTPPTS